MCLYLNFCFFMIMKIILYSRKIYNKYKNKIKKVGDILVIFGFVVCLFLFFFTDNIWIKNTINNLSQDVYLFFPSIIISIAVVVFVLIVSVNLAFLLVKENVWLRIIIFFIILLLFKFSPNFIMKTPPLNLIVGNVLYFIAKYILGASILYLFVNFLH